jgi:hypothetical protein
MIDMQPVSSSWVDSVGFDEDTQEIVILTDRGDEYRVPGSPETFLALVNAPSVGSYARILLRGR